MVISIISTLSSKKRAIGNNNSLLWNIPKDMKRFYTLTKNHPVIMGRNTWESIPEKYRPLRYRTNIIITSSHKLLFKDKPTKDTDLFIARSQDESLLYAQKAEGCDEIFFIGGERVYRDALPITQRLYLTLVDDEPEADTFFPEYENEFTKVISKEVIEDNGLNTTFIILERDIIHTTDRFSP